MKGVLVCCCVRSVAETAPGAATKSDIVLTVDVAAP